MIQKLGPYDLDTIVTGDARELAKAIPDESVDLIFTDPPYPKEYLYTYSVLSEMASRILKSDSLLFAYSGNDYLPEVIARLSAYLNYRCTICIEHGASQILWSSRFIAGWKPLLVFSKGTWKDLPILNGIVKPNGRDKSHHVWGQSVKDAIKFISENSRLDSIIFDPFTGGGTVPAACKMLGRHYLSFEIDPDTSELARLRVEQTQPALFVQNPEQAEMEMSYE